MTEFRNLAPVTRARIADWHNVRMVLVAFAIVAGLSAALSGAADASGPRQGTVTVFAQRGYQGQAVKVETSSDNRGWCVPVGKALNGDVGRSIDNGSAWQVKAYPKLGCKGSGFIVKPYAGRTGVKGGKIYVRSIMIVRP